MGAGSNSASSFGAARPLPPSADIGPEGSPLVKLRNSASKVQSVDQRMRLGMRCRLSPTADVPSHTSGAAMCQIASSVLRTGLFGQPRFPKTLNQQLCV